MKQRWEYRGVVVPAGVHSLVDGKRCYRFDRTDSGHDGTTDYTLFPVDEYWCTTQHRRHPIGSLAGPP